jgi:DNA modification methylase
MGNEQQLEKGQTLELNKIYNEDCLETMGRMPDKYIDLVVTSPPYDNLRTYNNDIDKTWNFKVFMKIAKEIYRVMKDSGVVVWVVNDATIDGSETLTSFKQALYFKALGFKVHDTMIYTSDKLPLNHKRYEQAFEYMFVFTKKAIKVFNPILERCKNAGQTKRTNYGEKTQAKLEKNAAMRWRIGHYTTKSHKIKNNIWQYITGYQKTTKDHIAFLHPAVFPEQLAKDHIISWSNEGDVVYDPFMGSGTTAIASNQLGRHWIGSEISAEYCEIAEKRIAAHTKQIKLNLQDEKKK